MKTKKIFCNIQFTGLHKQTTLLSIGIISDCGRGFYAEFTDYNKDQVTPWIKDNVMPSLYKDTDITPPVESYIISTTQDIKTILIKWLDDVREGKDIEFVFDCGWYNFILMIDLISGEATTMPSWILPVYTDVNNLIADKLDIHPAEAFDVSRRELLKRFTGIDFKPNSYCSAYEAYVIKSIHDKIS